MLLTFKERRFEFLKTEPIIVEKEKKEAFIPLKLG